MQLGLEGTNVRDYGFPGVPYKTQRSLMDALFEAMSNREVGLFESPTGTGKTLAVICAAATFLHVKSAALAASDNDSSDWVEAHASRKAILEQQHDLHNRQRQREVMTRTVLERAAGRRRIPVVQLPGASGKCRKKRKRCLASDERFMIHGDEPDPAWEESSSGELDVSILRALGHDEESGNRLRNSEVRIVFATRTHSQISQFVEEFRKTSFASNALGMNRSSKSFNRILPSSPRGREKEGNRVPLSVSIFGSRKHMCINDSVLALSSSQAISERCRELNAKDSGPSSHINVKRARSSRASAGCPYRNKELEKDLHDRAVVQLLSIEELAEAGRELGSCPYYASRLVLERDNADIICVPYSAVLHEPTRLALGLTIDEETVVIFDEAHNIVSAVCDLNSSSISYHGLEGTLSALSRYTERYHSRLAPSNMFFLRQLSFVLKGLLRLCAPQTTANQRSRVLSPSAVLFEAGIDNVNLYDLVEFLKDSKLVNKLRGFVDEIASQNSSKSVASSDVGSAKETTKLCAAELLPFQAFIMCLADCPNFGRVAIYTGRSVRDTSSSLKSDNSRLKFFVLEPGSLFASAVQNAHSVLLVGGTLSPREAIKERLFNRIRHRKVTEFECAHVVPPNNVCTVVCERGPCDVALEFTFKTRENCLVIDELGKAILKIVHSSPGGVVVFFASYDYLDHVSAKWKKTGVVSDLQSRKPLFFESRGDSSTFRGFQNAIEQDPFRGAVLCAVMGGRLSEGINFSDCLGRVLVIVGMPFANANDVETAEVLKSLPNARARAEFLENECLTTVNQSIGRSVRHANDFAAIVLMDRRYLRERVQRKLPQFARRRLTALQKFPQLEKMLQSFFDAHEQQSTN